MLRPGDVKPGDKRLVEPGDQVVFERLLGEAQLSNGDVLKVRWTWLHGSDRPYVSLWLGAVDEQGHWWPIPGRGIRISPQHLGMVADALDAARPLAAEWLARRQARRHWRAGDPGRERNRERRRLR